MLQDSSDQQVPLGEEWRSLRISGHSEGAVCGAPAVECGCSEELYPAQVPSLILQPMVENAVKHGIAKRAQGGAIRIAASRSDGSTLKVCNDGPMLPQGWEHGSSGIGMSNVRTRLQSLYGDAV